MMEHAGCVIGKPVRQKFFQWYDYESWYPLGRPIGTTQPPWAPAPLIREPTIFSLYFAAHSPRIYPGMQMTAVWIWEAARVVKISDSVSGAVSTL